jgi:glycosyltransferase involved in cell wall biosynthesis
MSSELLSVCIPTRNRAPFLRDLLKAFAKQIREDQLSANDVSFYVSDNASDDQTPEVFKEFNQQVPQSKYWRNSSNIGGDRNIHQVRTYAQGEYTWDLGDDELLADKALVNLVRLLRAQRPGLVISFSPGYEFELPKPQLFPDYRAFTRECLRVNPHALTEHTLISSNIYRSDCFDFDFALTKIQTSYPHMYGMLRALIRKQGSVALPDFPVIIIREVRAPVVDGMWIDNLDALWVDYLKWLRDEMQMPELDPSAPSEFARRALIERMRKHPLAFLRTNWRSIMQPSAYRFLYNRLFRKQRGTTAATSENKSGNKT